MKISFSRKTLTIVITAALVLGLLIIYAVRYKAATGAYVNGDRLLIDPVNKRVEQLKQQDPNRFTGPGGADEEQRIRQSLLEDRIALKVIGQGAAKAGLTVSDNEIDEAMAQQGKAFKDTAAYQRELDAEGLSDFLVRDVTRDQILSVKIRAKLARDMTVSPEEVLTYLKYNKSQFETASPQVKLSEIRVGSVEDSEKLIKELDNGMTWEAATAKYATDKKGFRGAWQLESFLNDNVANALKAVEIGSYTKGAVANLDNTLSVYRVEDRQTRKSLESETPEQIRARILRMKQERSFTAWFKKTYRQAQISRYY